MTADSRSQLTVLQRRQARRMAYRNAGLWGSGNGLISGTLVIYLATELGAPGIGLLWCTYHLLEYLGTVALWAWLADLVPLRIRGRFLGRREP